MLEFMKKKNMDCSHGYDLLTIECPYTQKFGLMCSMNHCDTYKSEQVWWCVKALKKVNNKYVMRSVDECPFSLKDNPCCMRHA